jgi:DsbC/DsbD-like thiol-disulfide interchange protein
MRTMLFVALIAQLSTLTPKPGHATVTPSPTDVAGKAGGTISLFVDVAPKTGIHVYAPGSKDYIAITVKLNPQAEIKAGKLVYPKSEIVTLADERVPVFQKPFRLTQAVSLARSVQPGANVAVTGTVNYQACDDKVCYPPESAPVAWMIAVK